MNRMLYVRKADETFWVRAEEVAKRRRIPLAVLVTEVLRGWFYAGGDKEVGADQAPEKTLDELVLEAEDAVQRVRDAVSALAG